MTTHNTEPGEICGVASGLGIDADNMEDNLEENVEEEGTLETANKFCVDYSKRGTAKCKICRKCIPKSEVRIGAYAFFKGTTITIFHHVICFFQKMKRARAESNVVQTTNDIDGFDVISEIDQEFISAKIEEDKCERTVPFPSVYGKKKEATGSSPQEKRKKLRMMKTPSIKILFTTGAPTRKKKRERRKEKISREIKYRWLPSKSQRMRLQQYQQLRRRRRQPIQRK